MCFAFPDTVSSRPCSLVQTNAIKKFESSKMDTSFVVVDVPSAIEPTGDGGKAPPTADAISVAALSSSTTSPVLSTDPPRREVAVADDVEAISAASSREAAYDSAGTVEFNVNTAPGIVEDIHPRQNKSSLKNSLKIALAVPFKLLSKDFRSQLRSQHPKTFGIVIPVLFSVGDALSDIFFILSGPQKSAGTTFLLVLALLAFPFVLAQDFYAAIGSPTFKPYVDQWLSFVDRGSLSKRIPDLPEIVVRKVIPSRPSCAVFRVALNTQRTVRNQVGRPAALFGLCRAFYRRLLEHC